MSYQMLTRSVQLNEAIISLVLFWNDRIWFWTIITYPQMEITLIGHENPMSYLAAILASYEREDLTHECQKIQANILRLARYFHVCLN
jgi:hypothetical protein